MFKKMFQKKEQFEYSSLPVAGKIHQIDDIYFVVLSQKNDGKGKRRWTNYCLRELETGDVTKMMIGWNTDEKPVHYTTTYMTSRSRPGWKEKNLVLDYKSYIKQIKDLQFKVYDGDMRFCQYKGNNTCQDLETGENYTFTNQNIKKELALLKSDHIVSVYKFKKSVYFVASYETKEMKTYYYDNKEWVDVESNKQVSMGDNVYFKTGSSTTQECYLMSCATNLYYKGNHDYEVGNLPKEYYFLEKIESKMIYGYLNVIFDEKYNEKLFFTDIKTNEKYELPMSSAPQEYFENICQEVYFAKAVISSNEKNQCSLVKTYPTSTLDDLKYLYNKDGRIYFTNLDTKEMISFSDEYLNGDIHEKDLVEIRYTADEDIEDFNGTGILYYIEKYNTSSQV